MIDSGKRLSESCLWKLQHEFYSQQGIFAWNQRVPFYMTSNPFIANSYAQLVIHFIRDWVDKYPSSADYPFYILELGAGCGRFSFLVIKRLCELFSTLSMKNISFCYVMSDFSKSTYEYWLHHPLLEEYIESGLLDFAIYDVEKDCEIQLICRETLLTSEMVVNPLIVFFKLFIQQYFTRSF